jgi:hypothetical protein
VAGAGRGNQFDFVTHDETLDLDALGA